MRSFANPGKLALATVTALILAAFGPAMSSNATYPGANGRIAFVRSGNVWTMNPNGTGQLRLTSSGTASHPQWSPDGKKIAYDQRSTTTGRDIWVMNANGSGKYRITTHTKNENDPTWSPDGRWLAFASDRRGRGEIFKIRSTVPFGAAIRLTTTAGTGEPYPTYEDPRLSDGQPSWSPTGTRIAFSRYIREDDYSAFGWATLLVTINVNGSGLTVAEGSGAVDCPNWSPGGARIAFADNWYDWSFGNEGENILQVTPDGATQVFVTHFFDFDHMWDMGCPSWSPYRGTTIAFSGMDTSISSAPAVYRVASNGSTQPVLVATNASDPDWGVATEAPRR